ncbi:uncharacterized protein EKO05_0009891 [Ascochyta rabiei]|uniref:Uncharacterized protein n=1 Tax=Didymella rabiei TaxID=5454 RepID=A0A163MHQ1_DIDRA|nr:uncharacterized protein EKO05_0009891 [Ascochyta rabiei]KZM28727.1 hypothetical protein ST47_g134 [Ascochyta rabiei]UPX19633.1 hypothetical protein EKO05_0009891 [Ascochyta rabiei]
MKLLSLLSSLAFASSAAASPLEISKRQSTAWRYSCDTRAAPADFKAFDLGGCTAQLSFTKDRYVAIQWAFEATYADGSRAEHKPFRDFNNFGVSDTFYPYLGNNFLTRLPGSSAFTAVHEFTNVCKSGQAPVSWRFYTTSANSACSPADYRYTTGQIRTVGGVSRPAKVSGVTLRRANTAGDFQVGWSAVAGAAAYSVIVQYPTGTDEVGDAYTNVRGARVQGTSTMVATTTRRQDVQRKCIVHAVNAQGVWSFTNDVQPIAASW